MKEVVAEHRETGRLNAREGGRMMVGEPKCRIGQTRWIITEGKTGKGDSSLCRGQKDRGGVLEGKEGGWKNQTF